MKNKKIPLLLFFTSLFLYSCSVRDEFRQREDFTSDWKFFQGDDSLAFNVQCDDSAWRILDLPHDWSIEADFSEANPATAGGGALPGGIGWYRKEFRVDASKKDKNLYVDFDGVYRNSKVWINGHLLGERPNGYISFRYDLTPYIFIGKKNVIAVRADNSEQPNSRWYSGSGIYRNVWLITVNSLHVDHWGTYITTPQISTNKAEVDIRTLVRNTSPDFRKFVLRSVVVDKDGKKIAQVDTLADVAAGETVNIFQNLAVNNPVLWSIENPYLYKVLSYIEQDGRIVDEYETPLGIRHFTFDAAKGFTLNDKPIKIKGVCQHHDLGCLGAAVNTRALERQLEILQTMGCNAIRTTHNPPAPELLDLCDKMGFIVMDEAFDMWLKKKTLYDYALYFPEWYEKDLTDMILRDRNHPSVFMWSIGNEVLEQWADDTELTAKLADIVKKLDPTRPVTAANNEAGKDNHLFRSGALDILGFNYNDERWAKLPETYPDWKLIITESTSSLMTRGYYEMPSDSVFVRPEQWDKPYRKEGNQCSSYDNSRVPWGSTHELSWKLTKNYDFVSGLYIWSGFDYLGEPTPYGFPSRSSYFGIIDLAGFPKDVYYMYQSEWTNQTVLHLFPHWNWQDGDSVDVWAYYNHADAVELFLNGESLGKKSKPEDVFHVWWRVPYHEGVLKAVSYERGKEVATKEIRTAGIPVAIRLTADRQTIHADGKDLSFVTAEAMDAEGKVVPVAANQIHFTVEGNGFLAGTDNGNPTDSVSLKNSSRNLFNGKALALVQAGKKSGNIMLKATGESLKDATIVIQAK